MIPMRESAMSLMEEPEVSILDELKIFLLK